MLRFLLVHNILVIFTQLFFIFMLLTKKGEEYGGVLKITRTTSVERAI